MIWLLLVAAAVGGGFLILETNARWWDRDDLDSWR